MLSGAFLVGKQWSGSTRSERLQARRDHLVGIGGVPATRNATATAYEIARNSVGTLYARRRVPPEVIRVRQDFVRSAGPGAPPLSTVVSSSGRSVTFALLALFVAQTKPGPAPHVLGLNMRPQPRVDVGWTDLTCIPPIQSTGDKSKGLLRRQSQRAGAALTALSGPGAALIYRPNASRSKGVYDNCELLMDTGPRGNGPQQSYQVPAGDEVAVCLEIPVEFFTNGWVFVLTDAEILTYLMLRHVLLTRGQEYVTGDDRREEYGVTDYAYEQHPTLELAGLLHSERDPGRRPDGTFEDYRRGATPTVARFAVTSNGLVKDGLIQVQEAVKARMAGPD